MSIKYSIIDYKHPDYKKVLELRLKAYNDADRFSTPKTKPEDLSDQYDQYSEIVVGKVGDRVICSLRGIIYPPNVPIEEAPFMKNPPNPEDCIGFSKFCVDPEYQGSTAAVDTFSYSGDITVKYGRKIISGNGFEDIVKFYERAGAKRTGESLETRGYKTVYVVMGNAKNIAIGKDLDLVHWSLLFYRAGLACVFKGVYNCDTLTKIKILIKLPFVPIARMLLYYKIWKRNRRKGRT